MSEPNDEDWPLTTHCIERTLADVRATPCSRTAFCPDARSSVRFALHVIAEKALSELLEHRATRAASAERVREVVREAVVYVLWPSDFRAGREIYAHDIAARAAEQLAGAAVGLSAEDAESIRAMRTFITDHAVSSENQQLYVPWLGALARLLASPPVVDYRAAICAILDDEDMPAGDVRKALAELVGRR